MHYHARDMAVVRGARRANPDRARLGDAVGRDRGQRAARPLPAACSCPSASAASICRRSRRSTCTREGPPRGRFIAPRLAGEVKTAIERGEQALLFLNRRGYAPLTLCRACGFRFACPNCDAWLVDHRFRRQLVCHHCGFAMPHPAACPKCQAADSFVACGPGVERLEEEVAALFPEARVLVLSSDLVATVERMREELADIARGPRRYRHRHAARRQGPPFPEAQSRRHRRCRSRPRATAIRAPPSARSSFCIRSSAAPAARRAAASASCRRTSPSIR